MNKLLTLFFIAGFLISHAQNSIEEKILLNLVNLHEVGNSNENFSGFEKIKEEIGDAQIVMLGEQSHRDATTFETKIKLIKYLHQKMGFEILAFESNIYECNKAWSMIQEGHDVKDALAKGINPIWTSVEELNPLFHYVDQQVKNNKPLRIAGFDPTFPGKIGVDYFAKDLSSFLATFEDVSKYQKGIQQLQSFINLKRQLKKIKDKKAIENIAFLKRLIGIIKKCANKELASFWIQSLKSLEVWISDNNLKTDNRDLQMAENLIWLKERYPKKKIICWGATSHFLYNASEIQMEKAIQNLATKYYRKHIMMGDYIKKKYGEALYTIGFIAYEGSFGVHQKYSIEPPVEGSLEYLIGKASKDNYFLSFKNLNLEGYLSRPLAHQNMTNDISRVMDAVIFNRKMRSPYIDWDFLLYLIPENKMGINKLEKLKQIQPTNRH